MYRQVLHLLIIVIVINVFKPLITYIFFVANNDEITAKYCVNLNKPDYECHAYCYLETQLSKVVDDYDHDAVYTDSYKLSFDKYQFYCSIATLGLLNLSKGVQNYSERPFLLPRGQQDIICPPPQLV